MEPNFQTSFIPKKPMIEDRVTSSRPIGFSNLISLFIFFTIIIAMGALYFYNKKLNSDISKLEVNLKLAQDRFEPSKIIQLQELDKRLSASSQILAQHISISPIFEVLEDITMKTVSFNKFAYELSAGRNPQVIVKMSGRAVGYQSIALQSDLFAKKKDFINPIFSNLALDDKGEVTFDLEFKVEPTFVDYENMIKSNTNALVNPNPIPF